jgi:GNAT superfamily N-acetyltransferase
MNLRFEAIEPSRARDEGLRAGLLRTWIEVTDAGGPVGFTAPAPVREVSAALDLALSRVGAGHDALGVLRAGGDSVGMGFLVDRGSPLNRHWRTVLRLMVRPDHQGGGAGTLLIEGLHAMARRIGLEQLQLTIRDGHGLEGFYTRFGYRVVGRHPAAVRVAPGDDRDEVMLVAALSTA